MRSGVDAVAVEHPAQPAKWVVLLQGNGEFLLLDRAASVLWWALFFAVALATAFGYLSAVAALSAFIVPAP